MLSWQHVQIPHCVHEDNFSGCSLFSKKLKKGAVGQQDPLGMSAFPPTQLSSECFPTGQADLGSRPGKVSVFGPLISHASLLASPVSFGNPNFFIIIIKCLFPSDGEQLCYLSLWRLWALRGHTAQRLVVPVVNCGCPYSLYSGKAWYIFIS